MSEQEGNSTPEKDDLGISKELKSAAEAQMRRLLPSDDQQQRAAKRTKLDNDGADNEDGTDEPAETRALIPRYDYSAAHEMSEGAGVQGFLVTCKFRRYVWKRRKRW